MKQIYRDDPDLASIMSKVRLDLSLDPTPEEAGRLILTQLYKWADNLCPSRFLVFEVKWWPPGLGDNLLVTAYEVEPHMSRENPYQSQASIDFYKNTLSQMLRLKLQSYFGVSSLRPDPSSPTTKGK